MDQKLLTIIFALCLLAVDIQSFTATTFASIHVKRMELQASPVAGSFFNPVPEDNNKDNKNNNNNNLDDNDDDNNNNKNDNKNDDTMKNASIDPNDKVDSPKLDDEISKLIRQRRKPARAAVPSTINGVPTSEVRGFGKKPTSSKKFKSSKPYVGIGPPDTAPVKPLNDISNPEYDDQGYTLYADEKTGKKSRVFEALVDYPCKFTMKIVGANEGAFVDDIIGVVAEACETEIDNVPHSTKNLGKWTSVTVKAPVQSAEMLYTLYERVDQDPRVKFKF